MAPIPTLPLRSMAPDPLGVNVTLWFEPPDVMPAAPAKVKVERLMAVGLVKLLRL